MSNHDARALIQARVDPRGRSQGISVEDKHYIVGRFSAWKGALKVAFDGAPDAYVLYLPSSNATERGAGAKHFLTTRATGFLGGLRHVEELTLHEHTSDIGLSFEKSAMVQQISEFLDGPVTGNVEFDCVVDLTTAKGSRLAALGHLVWNCLDLSEADRFSPAAIERLFQAMMIALLEVAPNSYLPRLERPVSPAVPWHVKRAIDYMHANLSQSLTVVAIAREAGTSVRALQGAFQRFKATTPLGYLRMIRLEAARKALVGDGNSRSIADAARNSGFTHMGRFAAAYYQAFGETPSETVRKR